jgi:hypothetical protein
MSTGPVHTKPVKKKQRKDVKKTEFYCVSIISNILLDVRGHFSLSTGHTNLYG